MQLWKLQLKQKFCISTQENAHSGAKAKEKQSNKIYIYTATTNYVEQKTLDKIL